MQSVLPEPSHNDNKRLCAPLGAYEVYKQADALKTISNSEGVVLLENHEE